MDSEELECLILLDQEISKIYCGIYSLDTIPPLNNQNKLMIINLDPSYKPGSHWVALYCKDNEIVEYFDSVGKKHTIL